MGKPMAKFMSLALTMVSLGNRHSEHLTLHTTLKGNQEYLLTLFVSFCTVTELPIISETLSLIPGTKINKRTIVIVQKLNDFNLKHKITLKLECNLTVNPEDHVLFQNLEAQEIIQTLQVVQSQTLLSPGQQLLHWIRN